MTYPIWDVRAAQYLAVFAHAGQVDKAGLPYIHHPKRVAWAVQDHPGLERMSKAERATALMVAWLHDVLEDTAVTKQMLQDLGCPEDVIWRVQRLSRSNDVVDSYYYAMIRADEICLLVKECDINDNANPGRLSLLNKDTQRGLVRTYTTARRALGLEIA